MKESITLIDKQMESYRDSDEYVIDKAWEIIKVRWRWPWSKDITPRIEYRVHALSQFAAQIAIEIEKLLKEKEINNDLPPDNAVNK